MKLLEVTEYEFQRVELHWHGPFAWDKEANRPDAPREILNSRGLYRAETAGQNRRIIKYIGSASESFSQRFSAYHRIKQELVDGSFRKVQVFLATMHPDRRITLTRKHIVEIEYILQNAHYADLVSYHGLAKLPKTSRGQGWKIVNSGVKGDLYRVVHYPAFAVSGQDR
ncbi:MAG: hypothetical protein ACTHOP_22245 [Mesorhizobium sp.]